MIELRINNNPIDLDEKSQVQLQAFNPALDEVLVARAFSWPFTILVSGAKLHALGHTNRLDARHTLVLPATVRVGGGSEWQGVVEVGSVRRDRLELVFKNRARLLSDKLKDVKIKDLMPVIEIPQVFNPYWVFQLGQTNLYSDPGVMGIVLWINGENFSYSEPANPYSSSDQWDLDIHAVANTVVGLVNAVYPGLASYDAASFVLRLDPVPGQEDLSVIYTYSDTDNIAISADYRTFGQARRFAFKQFIEALLVTPDERLAFPMMLARGLYTEKSEQKNPKHGSVVNQNKAGQYSFLDYYYFSEADGVPHGKIPFVPVSYLLKRISEHCELNGNWSVHDLDQSDIARMFVWNNTPLEGMTNEAPSALIPYNQWLDERQQGGYLHYATSIDLSAHVPDVSAADFLIWLCSVFNGYISDTDASLDIRPKVTQMLNAPLQASRYVTAEYEYTPKDVVVQIAMSEDPDDTLSVPGQLEPVGATGGEVLYVSRTFPDELYQSRKWGQISLASTLMQGQSGLFGLRQEAKLVRFFLATTSQNETYSGLGAVGEVYHATHFARNYQGVTFSPVQLELPDYGGITGLYNLYWRAWMPVLRGYELVLYLAYPAHRISILQEWLTVRMAFAIDLGQVMVLPRSIELSEQMQGAGLMRLNGVMIR